MRIFRFGYLYDHLLLPIGCERDVKPISATFVQTLAFMLHMMLLPKNLKRFRSREYLLLPITPRNLIITIDHLLLIIDSSIITHRAPHRFMINNTLKARRRKLF